MLQHRSDLLDIVCNGAEVSIEHLPLASVCAAIEAHASTPSSTGFQYDAGISQVAPVLLSVAQRWIAVFLSWLKIQNQSTGKVLGRISLQASGQELRSPQMLEKQAFCGMSMPKCFGLKNIGLISRSLNDVLSPSTRTRDRSLQF